MLNCYLQMSIIHQTQHQSSSISLLLLSLGACIIVIQMNGIWKFTLPRFKWSRFCFFVLDFVLTPLNILLKTDTVCLKTKSSVHEAPSAVFSKQWASSQHPLIHWVIFPTCVNLCSCLSVIASLSRTEFIKHTRPYEHQKLFYYLHISQGCWMLDSDWLTNILRHTIIFQQTCSYEMVPGLATTIQLHITLPKLF